MQISNQSKCCSIISLLLLVITCVKCKDPSSMIQQCMTQMCNYDDPITRLVQFPFRIKNRNESIPMYCGFPGFDLLCDEGNRLLINVPNVGEFFVEALDYIKQELWLNNPNYCLPKWLILNNLSNSGIFSPFLPSYEQVYWVYNCSNNYINSFSQVKKFQIGCLSGSSYGVIASPSKIVFGNNTHECKNLGAIRAPIEPGLEKMDYSDLSGVIKLTWVKPECGNCYEKGGQCGFESNSSLDIGCFNLPGSGNARKAIVAITLAFAAPVAFFAFFVVYFKLKADWYHRRRRRDILRFTVTQTPTIAPASPSGLDMSTIESYPKVVLGESRRLPKADDKSCAICLGEYLPKESLRTLPHCVHSFHAQCIDQWLTLNASCPVCRNSPARD